jgi:hypothetical protein
MASQIKVGDLKPLHSPDVSGNRPDLRTLSDLELLEAVNRPRNNDPIKISTSSGLVLDGNGRAHELLRRSAGGLGIITYDTLIVFETYSSENSSFWDL